MKVSITARAMFRPDGRPLYPGLQHAQNLYRHIKPIDAPKEVQRDPPMPKRRLAQPFEITSSDYELGRWVRVATTDIARRVANAMYFLKYRVDCGEYGAHSQRLAYEAYLIDRLAKGKPFFVVIGKT